MKNYVAKLEKTINSLVMPWRLWLLAGFLAVSVVAISSIIAQTIFQPFLATSESQTLLSLGESAAKLVMILLGIGLIFIFVKGNRREASGFVRTNIGKIVIWGVISALLFNVFMYIWGLVVPKESIESALKSMGFGKTIIGDIAFVITVTVLAPIGEEILFRGVAFGSIFSGLAKYKKVGVGLAALISTIVVSFVFANIHLGEGKALYFMIPYFIMALVFTYVYIVTGSLYTAIISHSVNNSFVVLMALIGLKNLTPATNLVYVFVILGPFLAFAASYLIERVFFNPINNGTSSKNL